MTKKAFKDYNARLNKEAFVKSLICGLIIGFSVLLVSAIVFWLTAFNQTWLCAVIWAAATAGTTPIFYYKKFRPTVKEIAKRIDELGLEERMLTMAQFEGDNSYIAVRQREDAMHALSTVNAKLIKFVVSVPLIVTLAIVGISGTGMVTVAALSAAGVLDSGLLVSIWKAIFEHDARNTILGKPLRHKTGAYRKNISDNRSCGRCTLRSAG